VSAPAPTAIAAPTAVTAAPTSVTAAPPAAVAAPTSVTAAPTSVTAASTAVTAASMTGRDDMGDRPRLRRSGISTYPLSPPTGPRTVAHTKPSSTPICKGSDLNGHTERATRSNSLSIMAETTAPVSATAWDLFMSRVFRGLGLLVVERCGIVRRGGSCISAMCLSGLRHTVYQ
jgi:hypothetical protein